MERSSGRVETSATIAPNIIRYLRLTAEARGHRLDRILHEVGIAPSELDTPGLRVSFRQGSRIIESAVDELGAPHLGLEVGRRQPITASGILGLGMMSSPRVIDAIALGLRFQNLAGSMVHWSTRDEGSHLAVIATVRSHSPAVDTFLVDEGFANFTRMIREVVAPDRSPERVDFQRPRPADVEPYRSWFRCDLAFGAPRNAWVLPARLCRTPLATADPWTLQEVLGILESQSAGIVDRQELVALLSARIEHALPSILPLGEHAKALAMSERTLRRRLAEVGATYSEVVDEVRRRRASELLRTGDLPSAQVATLIGYTDDRSLRRAVRRWFDCAPGDLRGAPAR